jgi:hypothetical protein
MYVIIERGHTFFARQHSAFPLLTFFVADTWMSGLCRQAVIGHCTVVELYFLKAYDPPPPPTHTHITPKTNTTHHTPLAATDHYHRTHPYMHPLKTAHSAAQTYS